ncbi:MAG: NAD(P)H-hydrate dehydratase [Dehalococcoidales bacterium]|jgi:NAD(P)H-hydrate epimerase|nr:NAD(P)H-hydrate dehydratase [Dehalococcoidales bacterium]
MKIVISEQMRQIEQECARIGLPTSELMENAGKAVAEEIGRILGTTDRQHILFLIGPGNNGGDGLVAARHLHDWGAKISIYLCHQRKEDLNLESIRQRDINYLEAAQDEELVKFDELLSSTNYVIDALFGTGKVRPLQGTPREILDRVARARNNTVGLRVMAVDLPSGLNADNGAVDPACLHADHTITLGFPKLGLFNFPGAERVGTLTVADIGIPGHLADPVTTELITDEWARIVLPERPLNANKGSFGRVLVAAGSINYIGAAYLACSGAIRIGAGLVTLAIATGLQPILAAKLTETTYLPLPESQPGIIAPHAAEIIGQQLNDYQVLLMGCGLGQITSTTQFVRSVLLRKKIPALVLDADALNALATIPNWWQRLPDNAILTPHPGEMARLSGLSVEGIQSNRIGIARKFAIEWRKNIVLKGAYTVIAAPNGHSRVSPIANPGLASAGTGDVLTGAIAGLVAQGLPLFDAAALGVHLHGKAGEMVKDTIGNTGMIATDLLPALPMTIKKLKESA